MTVNAVSFTPRDLQGLDYKNNKFERIHAIIFPTPDFQVFSEQMKSQYNRIWCLHAFC